VTADKIIVKVMDKIPIPVIPQPEKIPVNV
jgi:hypothetical protein